MNRNKRIIDCTPSEILDIGKKLIDYYFEKKDYKISNDPMEVLRKLTQHKPQFKEGEILCRDQKEL